MTPRILTLPILDYFCMLEIYNYFGADVLQRKVSLYANKTLFFVDLHQFYTCTNTVCSQSLIISENIQLYN